MIAPATLSGRELEPVPTDLAVWAQHDARYLPWEPGKVGQPALVALG